MATHTSTHSIALPSTPSFVGYVIAKCGHEVEVRAKQVAHLVYKKNVVGMYECSECSAAKFENFGMAISR